jgi:hypothetical protein
MKDVDEEMYNKVVDGVMTKYKKIKSIDGGELATISKELKGHWANIKKEVGAATHATRKTATTLVKKAKKAVN